MRYQHFYMIDALIFKTKYYDFFGKYFNNYEENLKPLPYNTVPSLSKLMFNK